jgi:hypothetical protein
VIEITLDEEYAGPTVVELAPAIPDIADRVVKVRWGGTKAEYAALQQFDRDFLLCVPDQAALDKAVAAFGKRLTVAQGLLERAKLTLADRKGYDWRAFVEGLGEDASPKFLLMKLAADAVRKGVQPALAEIVGNVMADGINPLDVDVLIRLKSGRMRG